ncbi:hypothetical protein ACXR0O_14860 [Verrucomicrobiota bacterium sgz303538]
MYNDRIDVAFTAEDLTAADGGLDAVEQKFAPLPTVTDQDRKHLAKMGLKNAAIALRIIEVGMANPDLLPRGLDLAKIERDLKAHEDLIPRMIQSQRITERLEDSVLLLGVDIYAAALSIYYSLKRNAQTAAMKSTVAELSQVFARPRKAKQPASGTP